MKIANLNTVRVDYGQFTNTGARKKQRDHRAQTTTTNDQDRGLPNFFLTNQVYFGQQNLSGIALQ
jgi:2-hydroxychromene-2-carboxylate isomerase